MFTCPSCYHEFDGVIYNDELGLHTVCPVCDSSFNLDESFLSVPSARENAGYRIISSMYVNENMEIVLGYMSTKHGAKFGTWECSCLNNYYWGHYFDKFDEARDDMVRRAAEVCGLPTGKKNNGFTDFIKLRLKHDCEYDDERIANTSRNEALDAILEAEGIIGYTSWIKELIEGIIGYTSWIKELIEDIYGIEFVEE